MHLEVVGTDRKEIRRLSELTKRTLRGMGLAYDVQEVTRPDAVAQHQSLSGPGIFIDGVLVCASRSVRPEDIENMVRWRHPYACRGN